MSNWVKILIVAVAAAGLTAMPGCRRRGTATEMSLTSKGDLVAVNREEGKAELIVNDKVLDNAVDFRVAFSPSGDYAYAKQKEDKTWEIYNGNGTKVGQLKNLEKLVAGKNGPVAVGSDESGVKIVGAGENTGVPPGLLIPELRVSATGEVGVKGRMDKGSVIFWRGASFSKDTIGEWTVSPDGNSLAYIEHVFVMNKSGQGGGKGYAPPSDKVVEVVNNLSSQIGPEYAAATYPVYSPDSSQLVVAVKRTETAEERASNQNYPVWSVIRRDGTKVGDEYQEVRQPVFSPDSRSVAFAAYIQGKWYVILNGKKIGDGADQITQLTFSPDSQKVVYARLNGKNWYVVVNDKIHSRGAGYEKITQVVALPDKIVFVGSRGRVDQKIDLPW